MSEIAKFAASPVIDIADGVQALGGGLLYIERTRSLVAADIHFGYEEVIGGALPLWSIDESMTRLCEAVARVNAREIILLGDVVHGPRMSEGAARQIVAALDDLHERCELTIVAGNHEGASRAANILGDTHDVVERDGWLLVHGDEVIRGPRCVIGHLHPSLHLGGGQSVPVFLAGPSLVVVPALTPYSPGLHVCSQAARLALQEWMPEGESLKVFGVAEARIYPFGALDSLAEVSAQRHIPWERRRKFHRRSPP